MNKATQLALKIQSTLNEIQVNAKRSPRATVKLWKVDPHRYSIRAHTGNRCQHHPRRGN